MINFRKYENNLIKPIDSEELKAKISSWGASQVGFGDVSTGLAHDLSHMPTAISIAVKHPQRKGIYKCGSLTAYSNQYQEVDDILEGIQKRAIVLIRSLGWRALAIPPDSAKKEDTFISRLYHLFPHKTAATCSGLGWIGKSGLLVNPVYGTRLSWATVLTDAPLEVSKAPYTKSRCGSCQKCVNACPASAIRNVQWKRAEKAEIFIDTKACANYLEYTAKVFNKYICGLCAMVCPVGNNRKSYNYEGV